MSELLSTEGLKKSFNTPAGELHILKGIDMVLNEGEMVSIVGASGVGKSTFMHILGTLDRPTAGKITYKISDQQSAVSSQETAKGIDPFSLSNGELAAFRNSVVGFVFQFHYLLPEFSALENVLMPALIRSPKNPSPIPDLKERAEKLLDELGIYARKDHKPGELSGGEQQRVAVARALFADPKVVLADEPTGNLDTATGEELFRLLTGINSKSGVSFVIVTHNESLSKKCHRTLKMSDGRLSLS